MTTSTSTDGLNRLVVPRHRVVREIGEGGMGMVFEAEQLEPLRRRVALKVLKAGMDTRAFLARFEAERQALAMMDHPGIARVYDAGATRDGHPYYTMEFVDGSSIAAFADAHRLSARDRVQLMLSVCDAVQHAHDRGVVHRDLKPPNILVSSGDRGPAVKIIDFGIAKALHGKLTNRTFATELYQPIGTAAYMSPEQWEAGTDGIDGRADVYALGVILFELLTGSLPHDPDRLARVGPAAAALLDQTPTPTPSQLLRRTRGAAVNIAALRGSSPDKLARELRGDLDVILMKALAPDRAYRYASARALREDLEHFLAARPVTARPPSVRYRIGRFTRRRPWLSSAIALTVCVVLFSWRMAYNRVQTALVQQEVIGALRRLTVAQYLYHEKAGRYATSLAQLPSTERPAGINVNIVSASNDGWSGIASPVSRPNFVCSIYVSADSTAVGEPICTTR